MDHIIKLKDGRHLGYAEYGDLKGKPLFFFHGWPSCRMHAKRIGESAKKLKIRIISIDRPGYGNSGFQRNRTLLDWANDVEELADMLGIKRFPVIGVSGGGPYAAVCGYKIPNRITKVGIVVGLASTSVKGVLNGMGFLSKLGWSNYHRIPGLRDLSVLIFLLQAKYLSFFGDLGFKAKPDQKLINQEFRRQFAITVKETFKQGIKGPSWDLKLYTQDWGFKLKDITAKVYLWYGASDKNVPLAMGKYLAAEIPNSKLVIYPNEGHLTQITHAEEILRTLID